MSKSQPSGEKARLAAFSKSLESRGQSGGTIFDEIDKLMSSLDLSGNSHQFNLLYDFVFFICRGDRQKNLTVNRAIAGWRLVLSGRFRLLDQWCNFVEMHQRNSISEDTWQQLLAFSQCVNEDLEGYDPNGAWPILIDNFVQHMYRINKSSGQRGSTEDFTSADADRQSGISESFSRLNLHSGSRRKLKYLEVSKGSDYDYLCFLQVSSPKDLRATLLDDRLAFPICHVPCQRRLFGIEARNNAQEESVKISNWRMQRKYNGSARKPSLSVFFSSIQLYAMLVDDQNKKTLLYGSTLQKSIQEDLPWTNIISAPLTLLMVVGGVEFNSEFCNMYG